MYQTVIFDLDGTLLNGAKQITPRTQAALERARQQGVLMVPVTGRPAQGLPPAVLSLPGLRYAVTSNGATIRDLVEQRVLLEKHLAPALCLQVLARCAHIPMIRQVFRAGVGYLSRPDYETLRARYAGTAMLQYHLDTRQVLPGTVEEFLAADARPVEELFFLTDSPQTKQALRQCPSGHCAGIHLLLRAAEQGQHGSGQGEPCKALARDLHELTAGHVSRQEISFCHRFHSSVEVTLRRVPRSHRNTSC